MEDSVEATVDLKTAAKLGMCTPRWVQQLVANGYVSKGERGRYRIIDVVHGRLRQILDDERRSSQSASASRVQDARAAEIELRVEAKKRAHLLDAEARAIEVIDEIVGTLKPDVLSIPPRVTKDLVLRRKLDDEIEGAFDAAADRVKQSLARLQAAGHPAPKTTNIAAPSRKRKEARHAKR